MKAACITTRETLARKRSAPPIPRFAITRTTGTREDNATPSEAPGDGREGVVASPRAKLTSAVEQSLWRVRRPPPQTRSGEDSSGVALRENSEEYVPNRAKHYRQIVQIDRPSPYRSPRDGVGHRALRRREQDGQIGEADLVLAVQSRQALALVRHTVVIPSAAVPARISQSYGVRCCNRAARSSQRSKNVMLNPARRPSSTRCDKSVAIG